MEFKDLIEADIERVLAASDDARRADAKLILAPLCEHRNGMTVLKPAGNVALDQPAAMEWLKANKPHLLPPTFENNLADKAFVGTGNKTAVAELSRQMTMADLTKLAQSYGKRTPWDTKPGVRPNGHDAGDDKGKPNKSTNPWADDSPGAQTRRVSIIKSLGTKVAADMAKAAGRTIGGQPLFR